MRFRSTQHFSSSSSSSKVVTMLSNRSFNAFLLRVVITFLTSTAVAVAAAAPLVNRKPSSSLAAPPRTAFAVGKPSSRRSTVGRGYFGDDGSALVRVGVPSTIKSSHGRSTGVGPLAGSNLDDDGGNEDAKRQESEKEEDKNNSYSSYDEWMAEQKASKQLFQRLMLPSMVGRFLNGAAWTFVIIGFVLQYFGYAYVIDDKTGFITVDTIEKQQFQRALKKGTREERRAAKGRAATVQQEEATSIIQDKDGVQKQSN